MKTPQCGVFFRFNAGAPATMAYYMCSIITSPKPEHDT